MSTKVSRSEFGRLSDGEVVWAYQLSSTKGIEITVITLGAVSLIRVSRARSRMFRSADNGGFLARAYLSGGDGEGDLLGFHTLLLF